jgi:hypothetical protein
VARQGEAFEASGLQVKRLLYGPTPADWGVEFCRITSVRVHQLQKPPATYSSGYDIPDRILWKPTEVEETEGPWKVIPTKTLASASVDSRQVSSHSRESFLKLVDDTQDDTGVIALVQQRASLRRKEQPSYRRRSISQPPILRRREVAYYARQRSNNRLWLGHCHLCPFDSRWKFGCHRHSGETLSDNHDSELFDVRSCARGLSRLGTSLQASWSWYSSSFLADVAICYMAGGWHGGTADCPWGCSKVSLDQLHVPEPLRPYHPRRW